MRRPYLYLLRRHRPALDIRCCYGRSNVSLPEDRQQIRLCTAAAQQAQQAEPA